MAKKYPDLATQTDVEEILADILIIDGKIDTIDGIVDDIDANVSSAEGKVDALAIQTNSGNTGVVADTAMATIKISPEVTAPYKIYNILLTGINSNNVDIDVYIETQDSEGKIA